MQFDAMAFADRLHGVMAQDDGAKVYRTDNGGASFVDISNGFVMQAHNVIGERRGTSAPDEVVIIGGHYDSYADTRPWQTPGAEDDASGTAAAMAAARAFKDMSFKRTVRYIGFGDEEGGCIGSWEYAQYCANRGEKIVAFLNADMVAYDEENGGRDDLSVAYDNDKWLFDYLKGVGQLYGNNIIYDHEEWWADHSRFSDVGYAAVGVIEGEIGVGGRMEYPYYHTAFDTLDKLQPAFGVRFVKDFAATLAHLARSSHIGVEEPFVPRGPNAPVPTAFSVYPNPYRYAAHAEGINFAGVSAPATVEVYDLSGRRVARLEVKTGSDKLAWRPMTDAGAPLAPGVYLYYVKGREQKKNGKLVIAE